MYGVTMNKFDNLPGKRVRVVATLRQIEADRIKIPNNLLSKHPLIGFILNAFLRRKSALVDIKVWLWLWRQLFLYSFQLPVNT